MLQFTVFERHITWNRVPLCVQSNCHSALRIIYDQKLHFFFSGWLVGSCVWEGRKSVNSLEDSIHSRIVVRGIDDSTSNLKRSHFKRSHFVWVQYTIQWIFLKIHSMFSHIHSLNILRFNSINVMRCGQRQTKYCRVQTQARTHHKRTNHLNEFERNTLLNRDCSTHWPN